MNGRNQHGLTRDIPDGVKREVRQRDGFGCVVCGNAIFDYEHFEPEFVGAVEHKANGIILLCDRCHRRKGHFLSKQTIAAAAANPKCRQQGFSSEVFDIGAEHPEITIGSLTFTDVEVLLRINGESILSIKKPEEAHAPFRLNALLKDISGNVVLEIMDNEWRTPTSNWDTEVVGSRIIVRSAIRSISLVVRSEPPSRIVIERINLIHRNFVIEGREGRSTTIIGGGNFFKTGSSNIFGAQCGISVNGSDLAIGSGGGGVILGPGTYLGGGTGRTFLT